MITLLLERGWIGRRGHRLPFKSASPSVNGCSDLDARHLGHAELARRQHAAVAGHDAVLAVDQYSVGEPKLADACGIWEPYFYGTGKSRAAGVYNGGPTRASYWTTPSASALSANVTPGCSPRLRRECLRDGGRP